MGSCGSKDTPPESARAGGAVETDKKPASTDATSAPQPEQPAPAAPTPDAVPEQPATAEGETPRSAYEAGSLDAAAAERVKALFKSWDIDKIGKLQLTAFTEATMQVGPHESKLLSRLADMDIDKDGFITDEEWLKWFTATASVLNADEFDIIMGEMSDAADNMVALIQCTRLAAEAETAEAAAADGGGSDGQAEVPPLEGARLAAVEKLFKAWDFEGKGEIDRTKVASSSVNFGPHKSRLFKQLESMDTDGDNVISLTEMKVFFQVVSPQLNDDDFTAVITEMDELAAEASTIAQCLALAAAAPTTPAEAEEVVKPTLPASRQELLGKLFGLFTDSPTDSINVAHLEKCTIEEGPYKTKLLKDLNSMDANSDGQLTLEEMTDYFAVLGASLSDEEFALIVGELVDACSTNQLAAQLAAFAASSE